MNSMKVENKKNKEVTELKSEGITKRAVDYAKWYGDVIEAAGLAEHAPVRGCMIILPYGFAIWELIQKIMDEKLKALGVKNAYFPLFIPESFLKKESEHIEGFSPELAIVTHGGGKKLKEPLIVRPTSETIIYEAFGRWINSYRDLPVLINQWANVVRWELRPRLFLRTTEFLWQEGHTAHATAEEAEKYSLLILSEIYQKFAEEFLAMPVYTGKKSEKERFAGAKQTFCMEALMQDGKSLQAATSHDLSDNFAKSFDVTFLDSDGQSKTAFQTSWGASTRLIGGIIMTHSDDAGLVLPPKIAPTQVILIPIIKEGQKAVLENAQELFARIKNVARVDMDIRENLRPGEKYYEWEKKGVPLRIEFGPKDLANEQCILVRRDTGEKISILLAEVENRIPALLEEIQKNLFERAAFKRESTNQLVETWVDFEAAVKRGGYIFAHWCEDTACEVAIKEKTKAGTRCQPFMGKVESGKHVCVHCGKPSPSNKRWIFAKAY